MNPDSSSMSPEMIHLGSHLAVIHWVLFSALTEGQQTRQQVLDPTMGTYIPLDASQHPGDNIQVNIQAIGRLGEGDMIKGCLNLSM